MLERRARSFMNRKACSWGWYSEAFFFSDPWQRRLWPAGLILVCDPLGRLSRSYGLIGPHSVTRCHSFVIDPQGILRYHLIHDLTDSGTRALMEMVTCEPEAGITNRQAAYGRF